MNRERHLQEPAVRAVQGHGADAEPELRRAGPGSDEQLLSGRRFRTRSRPRTSAAAWTTTTRASDRFFFRASGTTFYEYNVDWTYETKYAGPARERQDARVVVVHRQLDEGAQIDGHRHPGVGQPLLRGSAAAGTARLQAHRCRPAGYLDEFCQAQNNCMLPVINITGYQGVSNNADGGLETTNLQAQSNVTSVRGTHTLRGGDRLPPGDAPGRTDGRRQRLVDLQLRQLLHPCRGYRPRFSRQQHRAGPRRADARHSDVGVDRAERADLDDATRTTARSSRTPGARRSNLTLNFGLRYEYEDGIKEAQDRWLTEFDPAARLAITDLAQAAYARNPIPQVPVSDFRVLGGSVYAGDPGATGLSWNGRVDVDAARLRRLHAGRADRDQGRLRPVLRHAERRRLRELQPARLQRRDDQRLEHGLRPELAAWRSGQRHLAAGRSVPGAGRTAAGSSSRSRMRSASTRFSARASRARIPTASTRGCSAGGSACSGSCCAISRSRSPTAGPTRIASAGPSRKSTCRSSTTAASPTSAMPAPQTLLQQQVTNPFNIANFASLATTNPALYKRMAGNAFFTAATVQRQALLRGYPQLSGLTYCEPAARRRQGPRARNQRSPPLFGRPQRQHRLRRAPRHGKPDGRSCTIASRRCGRRARTPGRGA